MSNHRRRHPPAACRICKWYEPVHALTWGDPSIEPWERYRWTCTFGKGRGKEGDGIPPSTPLPTSSATQIPTAHANVGMFAQACKSPMCQSVSLPPTVAQQRLPRSPSVAFRRAASRFPTQGWTWTEKDVLLPVCAYTWPSAWWYGGISGPGIVSTSPGGRESRSEEDAYFLIL